MVNTFEYVLSGLEREGSLYDKGAGLGGGSCMVRLWLTSGIVGNGHRSTPTDRHDWKYYLPATSLADGNNSFPTQYWYLSLSPFFGWLTAFVWRQTNNSDDTPKGIRVIRVAESAVRYECAERDITSFSGVFGRTLLVITWYYPHL